MRRRSSYAPLDAYQRALGFTSNVLRSKYFGGRCGLCHKQIVLDTEIVGFRDRRWCHLSCTTAVTSAEYALQHAIPRVELGGDDSLIQPKIIEYEKANLAKFGLTFDPSTGQAK